MAPDVCIMGEALCSTGKCIAILRRAWRNHFSEKEQGAMRFDLQRLLCTKRAEEDGMRLHAP